MTQKEVKKLATEFNEELLATDKRFERAVYIVKEDGSSFVLYNSFFLRKDEWIIVFSEHQEPLVFLEEELLNYNQFEQVWPIGELKDESI